VGSEVNTAVFLSLIVCRCIPDHLVCNDGNLRYFPIFRGAGNWSQTEGSAIGLGNQVSHYLGFIGIRSVVVSFRRVVCRVLLVKPEGKRPLGRPRLRCKNNIMVNLHVLGCGGMDWIELAPETDI